MSVLGFGALFAGLVQIPGVDDVVHEFLDGSFEDSALYAQRALDRRLSGAASRSAALISIIGIGLAYLFYLPGPG